jgi:acetyl esterase/lipase
MVRSSAAERGLRENHIGILGFSAGGHLAAHASTQYDHPVQPDPTPCRPAFSILIYPVINLTDPVVHHGGSATNLLGLDASHELRAAHSPERQVTPRTPSAFLAHARDDDAVPCANSQLYHDALHKAGVAAALHLYQTGGHGFGMGTPPHDSAQWPSACAAWLKDTGWI